LLVTAAWKWARTLFPRDPWFEVLGHTIILGWGCIVAVAFALSLAGALAGPLLLTAVTGCALAALLWHRLARLAARESPSPPRTGLGWSCCWAVLLAFWLGHVVVDGLLCFPIDWDSLAYHIPLIDQWLHAGSLYAPDCARWSSPGNSEVLGLWMVAPFSGDFLVHLNNLPATLLLAGAAVGLGLRLGLSRALAHLGGMALVCNLIVLKQLVDVENDVAVAACFFAAALYIVRSAEEGGAGNAVLAAVSLGLLAGVKFYASGYAVLAGACWVLLAFATRRWRGAAVALLAGLAGAAAFGGYWYIRNLVVTGSPLYPKDFFRHPDLLAMIYPDSASTSFLGNNRPELLGLYLEAIWKMTGPCQLFGFVLAPLAAIWLVASGLWLCFRRAGPAQARARLALALLLCGSGVLLAITPFAVEDVPGTLNQVRWGYCPVRYGLCFLSLATLAALLFLQDALAPGWRWYRGLPGLGWRRWACRALRALLVLPYLALAGAILYQLLWPERRLEMELDRVNCFLIGGNLLLMLVVGLLVRFLWPKVKTRLAIGLVAAAVLAVAWGCDLLAERWHRGFTRHYDRLLGGGGFRALAKDNSAEVRVCALYHRCYPFFGSQRQYRVCQPEFVFSPEWLMGYFQQEGVTVVGAKWHPPWRAFQGFEECFARQPEAFTTISETHELVIFVIDRQRLRHLRVTRHAAEAE
jgi:hypothetical protein